MTYDRYFQQEILDAIEMVSVSGTATDMTATNSSLSSIDSKLSTTNTNLSTINTSVGTTNTSLTTVNTNLTSQVYGKYSGTVKTTNVTVSGTFPTLLPASPLSNRRDYLVMNISSTTLWVGGSDVTATNGIPVVSGTVFSVPLGSASLYGITSAPAITTSNIRIMEIS